MGFILFVINVAVFFAILWYITEYGGEFIAWCWRSFWNLVEDILQGILDIFRAIPKIIRAIPKIIRAIPKVIGLMVRKTPGLIRQVPGFLPKLALALLMLIPRCCWLAWLDLCEGVKERSRLVDKAGFILAYLGTLMGALFLVLTVLLVITFLITSPFS